MTERFSGLGMSPGQSGAALRARSRARSARRISPARRAAAEWRPRAPARSMRAVSGAAGKSRLRCASSPAQPFTLAEIAGSGAIQQIWITPANVQWRDLHPAHLLGRAGPSLVEAPLGDFFACGWGHYALVNSLAVCVNPGPRLQLLLGDAVPQERRLTLENRDPDEHAIIYWQINYTLTEVPDDCAYFHAQFRRTNPLPFKEDLRHPRRGRGRGPLCRDLYGLGRQQLRLVGRGRDQVLPRRRRFSDHLRHRHRGLFLRRL